MRLKFIIGVILEFAFPKIIRRLIDKALELSVKKVTGHRRMHGIFLLEEPIPLYRCEKARLNLGFSIRISVQDSGATIEWTPKHMSEKVSSIMSNYAGKGAPQQVLLIDF